jgi:hypothetical protein
MGFYVKDEPACSVAERPVTATLSRARKPRSQNAIPPILTVGIGHRFYSPSLGRWMSRDPIGEDGGSNLLRFCENRGIDRTDSLGLQVSNSQPASECPCDCFGCELTGSIANNGSNGTEINAKATYSAKRPECCKDIRVAKWWTCTWFWADNPDRNELPPRECGWRDMPSDTFTVRFPLQNGRGNVRVNALVKYSSCHEGVWVGSGETTLGSVEFDHDGRSYVVVPPRKGKGAAQ